METNQIDREIVKRFQQSPLYFIEFMWQLRPQEIKSEHKDEVELYVKNGQWDKVRVEHFEPFRKGKNITWQQWLIFKAVERSLLYGKNKISIVSGHGTGKSSSMSWLIIWHLFCHYDAQIGATAPTSEQIHDVLWKEVSLWIGKMPAQLKDLFEWQTGYIRVKERPETWFARARTARKESPEAISGLHGIFVLLICDESSGIADEIYRAAEGSLTGPNTLVVLVSNGTRNSGYFYDTHHTDKANWQTLIFNSEDSPIVEKGYIQRMEEKYGRQSDEFIIRVSGGFPSSEQMDARGWIPLLVDEQIKLIASDISFGSGRKVLGVDPSGEGDDRSVFVLRDNFQARVIANETTSNAKSVAMKTLDLIKEFDLDPQDVIIDNFGVGSNVAQEILLLDHRMNVTAMNWGQSADDEELYLNLRAEACFRAREWIIRGGNIAGDELKRDIVAYTYRNTLSGKKQILGKPELKQKLGRSPDRGDAFFMTFVDSADLTSGGYSRTINRSSSNDIHSAI